MQRRSLKEIRDAIPARLFKRDTARGLRYFARDIFMAAALWTAATRIDPYFAKAEVSRRLTPIGAEIARWAVWGV